MQRRPMGGLDIVRLSTTETNYTQSLVPQSPAARSYSSGTLSRSYAGLDLGGRIGCQWQLGRIVLGPDLEIGKLGIKQNANVPMFMQQSTAVCLTSAIPAVRVSTSGGFYTAAPLKAGLAVNDRLLVYVKGGAALYRPAHARHRHADRRPVLVVHRASRPPSAPASTSHRRRATPAIATASTWSASVSIIISTCPARPVVAKY